ncbi:MAG: flagellar biosynthetic protein FliO [Chloroflexi bacterium]|nr:flagellar biosynthetic protein FliO [Chloroflexota bacterium]
MATRIASSVLQRLSALPAHWRWPAIAVAALLGLAVLSTLGAPPASGRAPARPAVAEVTPGPTPLFRDYRELNAALPANADDTPEWQIGLSLVVQLAIVLGLIYLTAWGLKTLRRRTATLTGAGNSMQLIETVALTPQRTLHVVAIGDRRLVLGATDHQISLLTELDPPEPPAGAPVGGSGFESALKTAAQPAATPGEALERLVAKLNNAGKARAE